MQLGYRQTTFIQKEKKKNWVNSKLFFSLCKKWVILASALLLHYSSSGLLSENLGCLSQPLLFDNSWIISCCLLSIVKLTKALLCFRFSHSRSTWQLVNPLRENMVKYQNFLIAFPVTQVCVPLKSFQCWFFFNEPNWFLLFFKEMLS